VIATDEAGGSTRLEKLVRYCARPPLSHDRLRLREDGRVLLQLKTPWSDGTTHLAYDPLDFMAKLAALIPRPHKNLVLYHGVFAARSRWRARVVAYRREAEPAHAGGQGLQEPESRRAWATLMRRAFGYDLLVCARCRGKMVFLSVVMRRDVIDRILARAGPRG
jgi:Putative transposase